MSDKNSNKNTKIATTKEMSEILGLSDRRIRQLAEEGSLVRVGHGKFNLPASIQTYIESIKERSKSSEELDLNKERTLLTRANRQKVELELKIMKGELHRSEDVESVMNDMLSSFRAQMLVLPNKIAPLVLGQTELESVKSIIKKHIFDALQELSDYDPDVFYTKSKDKLSVDDIEDKGEESKKAEKGPRKDGNKEN